VKSPADCNENIERESRETYFGSSTSVLTSQANSAQPVTDAQAKLAITMVADSKGFPKSFSMTSAPKAFVNKGLGLYEYDLSTNDYPAGTHSVSVYGNAFAAQDVQFRVLPDR